MIKNLKCVCLCILLSLFIGCRKEENKRQCWYLLENNGGNVGEVCDKSRAEMEAKYNGQFYFYPTSDPKYCWKIEDPFFGTFYLRNIAQYAVNLLASTSSGYTTAKVDCSSFCKWVYQDRRLNKNTGFFRYGIATPESFSLDSCGKLFVGKEVIIRETPDSVYYRKFIKKED